MKELISVIVTVYNVEKYLDECIKTILDQTYTNIEIILVNDGSMDRSGDICDYYAQKDDRIRVIHQKNRGLVAARKVGVQNANGRYVGFVDADDWIESYMYEYLYKRANETNADVVTSSRYEEYSDRTFVGKNKVVEGVYSNENKRDLYSRMIFSGTFFEFGVYPTVWDKLFKKELLLRNQLRVPDLIITGEDVACTFPCLLEAEIICVTNKHLYHYRKREDSMLRTRDARYEERVFCLQNYLYERCKESKYWELLQPQIDVYIMDMILNGAKLQYPFRYNTNICNKYLFPFGQVPQGSKIVLYGAGNVGKCYYEQIAHLHYCSVVKWMDQNFEKKKVPYMEISNPEEIKNVEYDYVLLAVWDEDIAKEIKGDLIKRKISKEKILWWNPSY